MKKIYAFMLMAVMAMSAMGEERITNTVTKNVDGVGTTIVTTTVVPDSCASWYHADRSYYVPRTGKYTGGDFFDALDIPACFGIGFNPTGNEKGITFYSQMYIEWRQKKTYGAFATIGMDTYNQEYENFQLPDNQINVSTGKIINTDILLGGGYRLPLVKDLADFYAHPYKNEWNLSLGAQVGCGMTTLYNVQADGERLEQYKIGNVDYTYPVMKFNATVEWFISPMFSVFVMGSYIQHLTMQPWDNPQTHAGTLAFSIGLSTFFD